jgi:catechol 2,3-dioxygenase-like lactoylglutathione lyase family enzyme
MKCGTVRSSKLHSSINGFGMLELTRIMPFLIVGNLKTSISFYVEKLGFEIQYTGPDGDPFWAIVGRDKVSLMLKAISPELKPIPNHTRHDWAPWDAYVSATEPDTLYEEYRSAGVVFRRPLKVDSDGLLGFEVIDNDGYVLFFGRPE